MCGLVFWRWKSLIGYWAFLSLSVREADAENGINAERDVCNTAKFRWIITLGMGSLIIKKMKWNFPFAFIGVASSS